MSNFTHNFQCGITAGENEITLFVKPPGYLTMTPEEAIAAAHCLLEFAFDLQKQDAMTAGIMAGLRKPGPRKGE